MTSLLVCPSGAHQQGRQLLDAPHQVFQGIEISIKL